MATVDISNPSTGVNLAKRIRIVTRKLINFEKKRIVILQSYDDTKEITDIAYVDITSSIDDLIIKRNKLVERQIGYYASDTYGINYRINSDRTVFKDDVPDSPRQNIKECIKRYNESLHIANTNVGK